MATPAPAAPVKKAVPAKKAVPPKKPVAKKPVVLTQAQKAAQAKKAKQDAATMKWVAEKYGLAYSLIQENPDIKALFQTALKEKWVEDTTGTAQAKFMARLRQTKWWTTQSDEWRKLAVLKATDPATYKLRMAEAQQSFLVTAGQAGATFTPAQRDALINQAVTGGWDASRLEQAMAGNINRDANGVLYGKSGVLEAELKKLAFKNGVQFSDKFYVDAARSTLSGGRTADDWGKWIREQAAQQYAGYADQIRSGVDLVEAASAVTTAVAGELDLDPMKVGLQDKLVQQALTNVDESGKPAALPLWKVKDLARQDPRFMRTTRAQTETAQIGADVLKDWGVWK